VRKGDDDDDDDDNNNNNKKFKYIIYVKILFPNQPTNQLPAPYGTK
jgi:hypothetical protein